MSRFPAALMAATFLVPMPFAAQAQGVGWLDLLRPEALVQRVLQTGVMALRSQMDLQYGDLALDLRLGQVTMTDIMAWPFPEWDNNGDCEISVDRLMLRSAAFDDPDTIRLKIQVSGLDAHASCLPPDARQPLMMLGQNRIEMPRLTFDVVYDVPSSAADVNVYAEVSDAVSANLTAAFSYIWVDASDPDEPVPVMFLEAATLTLENRGIWGVVSNQLPPPFTDPAQAGPMVSGMVAQGLAEMSGGADGGTPALTDAQQAFVDSVATAWPAFLQNPRKLVLETGFENAEVYVDVLAYEDEPQLIFDDLRPMLALAPAGARGALPAALVGSVIDAVRGGAATLPEEDVLTVGLALLSGEGAPRDRATGEAALRPLAEAGNGIAALALSEALEARSPDMAYGYALIAGAAGEDGATARLDRLEGVLPFARVVELQQQAVGQVQHPVEALEDVGLMREQALKRMSGRGEIRSYAIASLWAVLGAATGDAESADILDSIDERVRLAGSEAAEAWAAVEADISSLAMEAWVGMDLPGRFGGN